MLGKIITDLCLCRNFTKVIWYCKASANSCLLKQSNNIKTTYKKLEYSVTSKNAFQSTVVSWLIMKQVSQ